MSDDVRAPARLDPSRKARDFAIEAHGDQRYGDQPYRAHLFAVHQVVRDFGYGGAYAEAAWLHDVLEDTTISLPQLRGTFSDEVCRLVFAVTGYGRNRKERNACIYEKIANFPRAAIIKVADRIANVEASAFGSGHRILYAQEARAFSDNVACYVPSAIKLRLAMAYYSDSDRNPEGGDAGGSVHAGAGREASPVTGQED